LERFRYYSTQNSGSVWWKRRKCTHYKGKEVEWQAPQIKTNILTKPSTSEIWQCKFGNFYITSVSQSFQNTFKEKQCPAFSTNPRLGCSVEQ
jgi:hypothetical protein